MSDITTRYGKRNKIDCLTHQSLEQIRAIVNGEEPTYTDRGGVGEDVRNLSSFALEQIRAILPNGGGQSCRY